MSRTTIEYWEKWHGREKQAMASIVDAFNAGQADYLVVMRETGDWSSSPDLPGFLAASANGTPPDVIGLEDHQVVDLAASGALSRIEPAPDLGPCRVEFTSLGRWKDALYAAPAVVDVVSLYINLDAVRGRPFEGGVIPASLDEFIAGLTDLESEPGVGPSVWSPPNLVGGRTLGPGSSEAPG